MERMNPYEFANLLCIFAQMDGRCADKTIRPRQMSFIEVESASDSTKKYEPICIDDIYVEYLYDRMDARQAAEEAINRIINAKEVVTKKAPEGPKAMHIMNIDSNHVLDILNRIMHDADNMPPEEPEEPEKPVAPVVKPVQPVQIARPSSLDDMMSALEDEEETDDISATPEPNCSEKPDASGDLYNAFDDDEDSDLLSALEDEEDGMAEQKPAESDNDETEEEPEETQEEERKVTPEVEPEISVQMEESSESTPFKVAQPALKDVKVVGTIDLDAINQRTRPPKKSKQERERDRREQKKANKPFVSAAKTEQPVASPSTDIVNKGEEDADIRKKRKRIHRQDEKIQVEAATIPAKNAKIEENKRKLKKLKKKKRHPSRF